MTPPPLVEQLERLVKRQDFVELTPDQLVDFLTEAKALEASNRDLLEALEAVEEADLACDLFDMHDPDGSQEVEDLLMRAKEAYRAALASARGGGGAHG